MQINQLTVLGAGVLGAQIAFQAAYHGIKVISYDINETALSSAKERFVSLADSYRQDLNASDDAIARTFANISQSSDLVQAVKDADIIIEAVPENLALKQEIWQKVGEHAKSDCIFTTNTSTILPSQFNDACGDKSRFLAMHFGNYIWVRNVVEIMGTADTSPDYITKTAQFAKQMGMEPVIIAKEQAGYIMNSLLVPLQLAARRLLLNEVASPKDIDKVWRKATGAPQGPFEIMDMIGLRTLYTASSAQDNPESQAFAKLIKEQYLDKGHTGKESGKGFFDYDNDGKPILD